MWHYRGGNCELLEMELVAKKPPHDDMKDALATCIQFITPPSRSFNGLKINHQANSTKGLSGGDIRAALTHGRFGGI